MLKEKFGLLGTGPTPCHVLQRREFCQAVSLVDPRVLARFHSCFVLKLGYTQQTGRPKIEWINTNQMYQIRY